MMKWFIYIVYFQKYKQTVPKSKQSNSSYIKGTKNFIIQKVNKVFHHTKFIINLHEKFTPTTKTTQQQQQPHS